MVDGLVNRKHNDYLHDDVLFYDHQVTAVRSLALQSNFILGDEMGLGKSLTSLGVAACDWHAGYAKRGVIVAPAGLKGNWADEIDQFTNFTHMIVPNNTTSPKRKRMIADFAASDVDFLIANYEQVNSHLIEFNRLGADITICDEAHYIKGPDSVRSLAIRAMLSRRWFLLTGSPLLNHVDDLWALLNRVDPAKWPGYYQFVSRYAVYGGYKDKAIIGVKNPRELEAALKGVMIRRLKKDCLDLPEKIHVTLKVDLHPEQKILYDEVVNELQLTIPDEPNPRDIENALTKMLHLKMICGTTAAIDGYDDHSYKLDLAVERIQELIDNDKHVVVFTQFRAVLEALHQRLTKLKKPVLHFQLHGDVPIADRKALVTEWSNAEPSAFLCMLQVGGQGLTMTAASTCIFVDKLWSPKMNEQAEDRLHRIGASLTEPVTIINILVRGTVETRIEQILKAKTKVSNTVLGDDDSNRAGWTKRLIEEIKKGEISDDT